METRDMQALPRGDEGRRDLADRADAESQPHMQQRRRKLNSNDDDDEEDDATIDERELQRRELRNYEREREGLIESQEEGTGKGKAVRSRDSRASVSVSVDEKRGIVQRRRGRPRRTLEVDEVEDSDKPEKIAGKRKLSRELQDLKYWFIKETPSSKERRGATVKRGKRESDASTVVAVEVPSFEAHEDEDTAVEEEEEKVDTKDNRRPARSNSTTENKAVVPETRSKARGRPSKVAEGTGAEDVTGRGKDTSDSANKGSATHSLPVRVAGKRRRSEKKDSEGLDSKRQRGTVSSRELSNLSGWQIKEQPSRRRTLDLSPDAEQVTPSKDRHAQPRSAKAVKTSRSVLLEVDPTSEKTNEQVTTETEDWVNPGALWRKSDQPRFSRSASPLLESRSGGTEGTNTPANTSVPRKPVVAAQKPWPRSQRLKPNDPLPENTVCISQFLSDEDIRALMPDLDEAVLTRARKRAEGPRGERLMSRRASSAQAEVIGVRRNSVVNGSARTVNGIKAQSGSPSASRNKPALTIREHGDLDEETTSMTGSRSRPKEHPKRKKEDRPLERNIDNVVFGDVTFKAWYPSWYPKEIIGEKGLNGDCKGIVVQDLYVCKRCFAYSKTTVEWVRHTRCCEKTVPGEQIYTHGSQGVWSIWEVDGDVDTLFCQNLSLFAKLFLDNKSVFFDVSGFKYFLLVHTRSIPPPQSTSTAEPTIQQQIVGFFSKEKMSWDNNNLACILVFPPWQKKSLGTLLMGVSYAISRREKVLGGPEKPISELGRKGYKRYWGAEIARWLLECKETDKKGKATISVSEVSEGTWIVADDCLAVLRDMGVVEKVGGNSTRSKDADGEEIERVRLDKQKVREWVERVGLSLDRVIEESGFVEGYAVKEEDEDEVMDDV